MSKMDYNITRPIIELYQAIQSEGSKNGIPHIIVRTTGCTHRCWFGEGGWCDTWYTSIHAQKGKYSLQNIRDYFEENKDITHLMLTGGSPTMHPELCDEIITLFKEVVHGQKIEFSSNPKYNKHTVGFVTIETEGSHFIKTKYPIDLVSLSPKFKNSVPKLGIKTPQEKRVDQKFIDQHNKFRLNYEAISKMIEFHTDYHYKPVWDGTEESLVEIEAFRVSLNIPKNKTWIMPAGDTRDELIKMYPVTIEMCQKHRYNFSGRDHIIAFGDKREV